MDPKASSPKLDPKLQEAYDRVMGTVITSNHALSNPAANVPNAQAAQTAPPAQKIISTPIDTTPKPVAATPTPQPTTQMPPMQFMQSAPPITPVTQAQPIEQVAAEKKGVPLIVWVLGGIIFLTGYTYMWIKIFNVKIPFLPF